MSVFRPVRYFLCSIIAFFPFFAGTFDVFANDGNANDPDRSLRIAVVHTTQLGKRHHDEFDVPLSDLAWSFEKYDSSMESMEKLVGVLDRYDMVLATPLFNYENNDLTRFGPAFRKFIELGGALVVTDALYPQAFQWLNSIDPALVVGCEGNCSAGRPPLDADPTYPLRFLPNVLNDGNSWGHLTVPENHSWEIVACCGEGKPTTVMKRLGRGFVYVTAFRQPNRETLENLRTGLELQRINLQIKDFRMPESFLGAGTFSLSLRNPGDSDATILACLEFGPADSIHEKIIKLSKTGEAETVSISFMNRRRGNRCVGLTLEKNGETATVFDRRIELPDLLTVRPPRYRGFALDTELKRTETIVPGISIVPLDENLDSLQVKTYATDRVGKILGKVDRRKVETMDFRFPLEVGPLPAGVYRIHAELFSDDKELEKRSVDFEVLDGTKCKAFINDDMNLLVDGEPFFPLGLYHINAEDLELYGKDLGINLIQLWNWYPAGLGVAEKLGIKVLWEMNHRNAENVMKNIPALTGDPAIVLWYARDEPYEAEFAAARALNEAFHQIDPGRPTFMVSDKPRLYEAHVELADIFAPDPYPYPKSPLTQVSDLVDLAWKATKGDKPVFAVLQSFGGEPASAMRVMTYLATRFAGFFGIPGTTESRKESPAWV